MTTHDHRGTSLAASAMATDADRQEASLGWIRSHVLALQWAGAGVFVAALWWLHVRYLLGYGAPEPTDLPESVTGAATPPDELERALA